MERLIRDLSQYSSIIKIREYPWGVVVNFVKEDATISISVDNITKPVMENILSYFNTTFPEPINTESHEAVMYNDIAATIESWIDDKFN